ncbi:hypothetical protein ACA910_002006 [Epithemia clementina (nom. ined.)]
MEPPTQAPSNESYDDSADERKEEGSINDLLAQSSYERTWNRRYKELVEFNEFNGNCSVPSDYEPNRKLGNWVRTQRAQFKLFQYGMPCTMTEERVLLLEKINFPWKVKCDWMMRYKDLENYFNYHGNSLVPTNWTQNRSLGRWVDRQRTAYRLYKEGKPSTMTEERIKMLEQLHFKWKLRDDWYERYEELVTYFNNSGDTLIPPGYPLNPGLAKWVDTQRHQFRLFNRNRPCSMTQEKIDLLHKIGFQWKLLEDWYDRFRELEEYVTKHGDTLVPQHYASNPSLGIWVRNQRTQFKLFKEGKASKLLPERVKMLETLNFEWNAYEAKWMASFVELGKHVREHGLGTIPSYHGNRRLRNWVEEQRKQYRRLEFSSVSNEDEGQISSESPNGASGVKQTGNANTTGKCRLTPKRIELLDLLGFPWDEEKSGSILPSNEECYPRSFSRPGGFVTILDGVSLSTYKVSDSSETHNHRNQQDLQKKQEGDKDASMC